MWTFVGRCGTAVALAVVVSACESGVEIPPGDRVATIDVSPSFMWLDWAGGKPGDTSCSYRRPYSAALTSWGFSADGLTAKGDSVRDLHVSWTSRDTLVATVDTSGVVRSRCTADSTWVVARAATGVTDSALVHVTVTASPVDTPPPVRTRRELYDLVATFTRVHAGSHADTANASIVGVLALVDTVVYSDGGITVQFPMTLVGTFCYDASNCQATSTTWPGRFTLGADGAIAISLYREGLFTIPVLQFHGTLVDRTMTGTAAYQYTNYFADTYNGTFVATRK